MAESPRTRRLRTDQRALHTLQDESSIFAFSPVQRGGGGPPEAYLLRFFGRGLYRPEGSAEPLLLEIHEVAIELHAAYPRMMPQLRWQTPLFHPNVSASGVVCLGGYGTHWVPSLNLDELCTMLWDMIRYENFDPNSPYNREAARWVVQQRAYRLPTDDRPIRDKVARQAAQANSAQANARSAAGQAVSGGTPLGRYPAAPPQTASAVSGGAPASDRPPPAADSARARVPPVAAQIVTAEVIFLDDEPVEANIVESGGGEVLIIE